MVSAISSQAQQIGGASTSKASAAPAQTAEAATKGNCQPCTNCGACGKIQDPSTVTQDQLKSPIDIRV